MIEGGTDVDVVVRVVDVEGDGYYRWFFREKEDEVDIMEREIGGRWCV